ncbi:hypothetical protein GF324_12015 [bacterium]|nr:hypothetical protein [bacterium]
MKTWKPGFISAGALAVIIAGMLLVPASYEVTVGSTVSVDLGLDRLNKVDWQAFRDHPDFANLSVAGNGEQAAVHLVFRDLSKTEAGAVVEGILAEQSLAPGTYSLMTESITKTVGGNALAALSGGTIRIMAHGLTDDEVETAIVEHLQARGIGVNAVDVRTTEQNGMIRKDISIDLDSANLPEGMQEGDSVYFEFEF